MSSRRAQALLAIPVILLAAFAISAAGSQGSVTAFGWPLFGLCGVISFALNWAVSVRATILGSQEGAMMSGSIQESSARRSACGLRRAWWPAVLLSLAAGSFAIPAVGGTAGPVATESAAPVADPCERFRHLEGKAWVDGPCMETPLGSRWWPNPLWGADDQAGSTNWYTKPEVVARALAEVRQNRVLKIGQVYSAEMPLFGTRSFSIRIPGAPTGGPVGLNRGVWNDEYVATEIGQVGTQFDGLGHIGVQIGDPGDQSRIRFYNGHTLRTVVGADGLRKLGVENLHPIVARGVLIDVAAARGVDAMKAGDVIGLADVRAALKRQGMADFALMPGDAVLFRTGWERYWVVDNATYNAGCPGIGMEVARWLAEGRVGVTGADTWPVDAVPNPDPDCEFCVHTYLQARHGIVNQENLKLSELAGRGVYRFAYLYTPVPIRGATGSPGSPVVAW